MTGQDQFSGSRARRTPFDAGGVSLGIYLPPVPPSEVATAVFRQATVAIESGFDGITIPEHHGQPTYPPNPVLLAVSLAAVVPGRFAAAPFLAALRPPMMVAEDVAWAWLVTNGRFGVALGAGYDTRDFEEMEVPYSERGRRFRRAVVRVGGPLAAGVGLGRDDDPAFAAAVGSSVPVLLASGGPRNIEVAARQGLGLFLTPLPVAAGRERVDRYHEAGGSGPVVVTRWAWVGSHPDAGEEAMNRHISSVPGDLPKRSPGSRGIIVESSPDPVELGEMLTDVVVSTGGTHLNLRVRLPGVSQEEQLDQIETLATQVLPVIRDGLTKARGVDAMTSLTEER